MSTCTAIANVQVNGARPEESFVANRIATQSLLRLVCLLSAIILCLHAFPLRAADSRRLVTVPALGVLAGWQTGIVHYVVLQIDKDARQKRPTIQFNEIHLGGGSVVSDDWKEGVKHAVAAATKAIGEDGREWVITIKNRSYNGLTEGMSASSAIAVGIVAAWRGASRDGRGEPRRREAY